MVELEEAFDVRLEDEVVSGHRCMRRRGTLHNRLQILSDVFPGSEAECRFLRWTLVDGDAVTIEVRGSYELVHCRGGGWLLMPDTGARATYWIPALPMLRNVDNGGRILEQQVPLIGGLRASPNRLSIVLYARPGSQYLDLAVWRIGTPSSALVTGLCNPSAVEQQPIFLWSSHTTYRRASDLYDHLIFGSVYENQAIWPKYWRICSELDAHALFLTLHALEAATGKELYRLMKRQIVYSVIARQAEDGGWYHGEWTDQMESHYRLHNGGIHLLAASFEAENDERVREALAHAAEYLADKIDKVGHGVWFLHDSLELDVDSMERSPFRWISSRALGKSESNMLVLNTHLDAVVALDRYRQVTGDEAYAAKVDAARDTMRLIVHLKPMEWLYRGVFWAVGLTLLPVERAKALPLPIRAIKRLARNYLIPRLHYLKAAFPRLVMPSGYIDRALTQQGLGHAYQSVNVWDLLRYQKRFPEGDLDEIIQRALVFTIRGGLKEYWKEQAQTRHALGFLIEVLYHLCAVKPDPQYRLWLAEAVLDATELQIGLPPSVLGGNFELFPLEDQRPCPSPCDNHLGVINLCRDGHEEVLVVNWDTRPVRLTWGGTAGPDLVWVDADGADVPKPPELYVPPRGWVWGRNRVER